METLFFKHLLLPEGWASNVRLGVNEQGIIQTVEKNTHCRDANVFEGPALPGMPNLHSHAFQRALAGLTEFRSQEATDSFWSWRKQMYHFVHQISADQLRIIANQLYIEMLKAGYTSVAEFHYLHHATDGSTYQQPAMMSEAIIEAASNSGIGLTLLPVLYMSSGFGMNAADNAQRRFIHTPDQYLQLIQYLRRYEHKGVKIGIAPHSLRAVPALHLKHVTDSFRQMDHEGPIHIHIAEQQKEILDCQAFTGNRPVEWLLDQLPVDKHWCLVHATHMTAKECKDLANTGAVAGLCPTTEANLGDGLFSLSNYVQSQGQFGIGSDSNSSVSVIEELRWLEYGQRLFHQQRNIATTETHSNTGLFLWQHALAGGAQALGQNIGRIEIGCRADVLVLNKKHPSFQSGSSLYWVDSLLFSGNDNPISEVLVAGKSVISDGHHPEEETITKEFTQVMKALRQ